jgi:hypothetical protein
VGGGCGDMTCEREENRGGRGSCVGEKEMRRRGGGGGGHGECRRGANEERL